MVTSPSTPPAATRVPGSGSAPDPALTAVTSPRPDASVRIDDIGDLLAAVGRLSAPEQRVARARVAAAIERPAVEARAALGLLALDVAGQLQASAVRVIVLPDLAQAGASADPVVVSA